MFHCQVVQIYVTLYFFPLFSLSTTIFSTTKTNTFCKYTCFKNRQYIIFYCKCLREKRYLNLIKFMCKSFTFHLHIMLNGITQNILLNSDLNNPQIIRPGNDMYCQHFNINLLISSKSISKQPSNVILRNPIRDAV